MLLFALLACSAFAAPLAHADGTPDISATVASTAVLFGAPVHVTVTATNPPAGPYGYNLSYRVVLPAGVSYSGGAGIAPTQIADQPARGETTLIFGNVSDLSPSSSHALGFDVTYSQTTYDAGMTFPITAQAFLNTDPRFVPKFTAAGMGDGGGPTSYTGSTPEVTGTQTLRAIEVTKAEPSPEGEIVRGVHDNQTVYTVTVRDNGVNPTDGVALDDYLPAGLEFLGCGGANADNTTDAPTSPSSREEYPGSGPIDVASLTGCVTPLSVNTETVDPDGPTGPMPSGVYTHVVWDVGTLTAGQVRTFTYRAAVPMRANTMTFTGPTPSAASLGQATNLDNNSGPEVTDETPLDNYASAAGTYQGRTPTAASDATILHRTAEDWAVQKSGSSGSLAQGAITTWTLNFETSEYKYVDDATITDTLPNGLCPLGASNFTHQPASADGSDSECDPTGDLPDAPYTSAVENADGTWTLTWDRTRLARLGHTAVDDRFTLRFPTRTRSHYQSNFEQSTPILTRDTVENDVSTDGSGFARCTGAAADCSAGGTKINHDGTDGSMISDASSAGQQAADPTIDKQIGAPAADESAAGYCTTATYVNTVPHYHPGDRVCWKARVDFPAALDTSPQAIADFLPAGVTYDAGTETSTASNNVTGLVDETNASTAAHELTWTVTGSTVPIGSKVFERTFSTTAQPAGTIREGDIVGNLLKFSSANTPGVSTPLRDEADFVLDTPTLGIQKGVASIERNSAVVDGPNDPGVDGRQVEAGDRVTYSVVVRNTGLQDAVNAEVWDQLPAEYRCTGGIDPTSLNGPSETCDPGTLQDHIRWVVPTIAAGGNVTLTYTAIVPSDIGANRQIDNTAGVRQYQGATNLGGFFTYTPSSNIDPSDPDTPNVDPILDGSSVHTAAASVGKTATTSVTESGNTASQATIGEDITYTVTATIPEGTTLGGSAQLTDAVDSTTRQPYLAGSATATLNGVALPAGGLTLDTSGATPVVNFPANYANAPGTSDDVVVLTFRTRVADVAGNTRASGNLTNQATLGWSDPVNGAQAVPSPSVSTQIVEPSISQAKTDDRNPARVTPGDIVTYTVKTSNAAGARVSTAHDVAISDLLPIGLTPVDAGNAPLGDGATVPGSGGATWNAGPRTITRTVTTIAPNANDSYTYRAKVDDPAIGGSRLRNTVTAGAASLDASATGRRTTGTGYGATANDTIQLGGATISKTVTPPSATIGDPLTYTLTVTIPADISLFDTTVTDLLPDSLDFDGYGSETCVSGCSSFTSLNRYTPVTNGNGTTTIAWDIGDIGAVLPAPEVISITYTAHVRATHRNGGANVVATETAVNAATVGSNTTDRDTFDPSSIPTGFDDLAGPARATTTVVEPTVAIDKRVSVDGGTTFLDGPATAHANTGLGYELVVRNTGGAPAYDVAVRDQPDAELTNVVLASQAGVTVTDGWTAGDPSIGWSIDTIPAGGSVTLRYSADLVAARSLSDGQRIDNSGAVPDYFGAPAATRTNPANASTVYRDYRDGGSDVVEAVLDVPSFTTVKTTGAATFPETGNAEIGQVFAWRVIVTNTSSATASDVQVTDALPPNWAYTAGSATIAPGGAQDPTITPHASGDRLVWTVASLGPGASATITYDARPQLAAATTPGTGAGANVNSALVSSARDEAGNTADADGAYGSAPDTATATLLMPALSIAKTPDGGAATAGSASSFTIAIRNTGNGTARNLDVSDVLPDGLAYTAGSATAVGGTGFSEASVAAGPGRGETTIHWNVASLAAGGTATVTVPVGVASDVPDGTTLTNTAGVGSDELPTPVTDTGSLDVGAQTDVAVLKTGAATYTPGGPYTWHLRVQNNGPSDAQGVVVDDPLPAGTTFASADAPCAASGSRVTCPLGAVPMGFDHTYDVTVITDPGITTSPLDNTATISSTTTDTLAANDTSTFGPTPSPIADLSIAKTASPQAVLRGQQTTFTLTAHNAGPSVAHGVTLIDALPTELTFVSADGPGCANASGTVTCPIGDIAPGANVTVHVVALATTNGIWTNSASVGTATAEPLGGGDPDTASASLTVGPVADLALAKTGPATVPAGGQLTWSLAVTNNGPDPATGVTIVDGLPAGTVFASADTGCTNAGETVTCAVGPLANGATATRQVTVTVPVALGDATVLNSATVHGDQGDDHPENNPATASTQVGPSADLAIAKSGPSQANADGTIAWTLVASNGGPSTATGVNVTDAVPAGASLVSATPTQGSCSANGQTLGCALGTLANGGAAQIQVVAHLAPTIAGQTLRNSASIGGQQPDPNSANNSATAATSVGPPAPADYDLALAKSVAAPAKPAIGQRLRYALTVTNHGPAAATKVKLTDTLPSALHYVSASLPGGRCTQRGSVVTCTLASLASGARRQASVTVVPVRAGKVSNTATVAGAVADERAANNRAIATTTVATPRAVLRVVKTASTRGSVEPGQRVRFRIRVTATGRAAAAGVVVCDRLPSALTYVSVAGAHFRRGDACWTIGLLEGGASRTVTVLARVAGDARAGAIRNAAVATADNAAERRGTAAVRVSGGSGVLGSGGRGGGVTG
jgi:uncharacterized repeat protein (TIGR01451 family)/fimbrial isopeptide formation D2 family protein